MHYRLYILDARGKFAGARDLHFGDDDEALTHARAADSRYGVELWQGERKLVRLVKSGDEDTGSQRIDSLTSPASTRASASPAGSSGRAGLGRPDLDLLDQNVDAARAQVARLEVLIQRETERGGPAPPSRSLLAEARENLRRLVVQREATFTAFMKDQNVTPDQGKELSSSDATCGDRKVGHARSL